MLKSPLLPKQSPLSRPLRGKRREFQWAVGNWSVTLRFDDIEIPIPSLPKAKECPHKKWIPAVVFTALSFLFIAAAFFITSQLTSDQRIILNSVFALCTGMSLYFMGGSAMARYRWHGPKVQFTFVALAGAAMFALVYLNPLFVPPQPEKSTVQGSSPQEPPSRPQAPGQSSPQAKNPSAPPAPKGLQGSIGAVLAALYRIPLSQPMRSRASISAVLMILNLVP
jgi:hypothetical protein